MNDEPDVNEPAEPEEPDPVVVASDPVVPRLPTEGSKPYAALLAYIRMGPGRSLDGVRRLTGLGSERPERSLRLMERWSSKYSWIDRARVFDNYLESVRQRAVRSVAAREAATWERRTQMALHSAWEDAQALRKAGKAILNTPIVREMIEPDGKVSLRLNGCRLVDAARFLRTAAEIEAAALTAATRDISEYTDEELRAIASAAADDIESFTEEELVEIVEVIPPEPGEEAP
jgi:hypothetical protein